MARRVEGPWFREGKNGWYATIHGKMVWLKVKGRENRDQATANWHRLMASGSVPAEFTAPDSLPAAKPTEPDLKTLARDFLETKQGVVKQQTLVVYRSLLAHCTREFGDRLASTLKNWQVTKWLGSLQVGTNTKHDLAGILVSVLKWAEDEERIAKNPLKKLKRPARQSRGAKARIAPDAYDKLLAAAHPALRTLLTLLHETGARPSELSRLEASHCDFENGAAILNEHKTADSSGKPRLIALSPAAMSILKPLAEKRPTGPLLLNGKNKPWKKDAITLAFTRASAKAGVKVTSYQFRHDFATAALTNGVPDATVAALLGHSSTQMLHKHYSHLTSQARTLRSALNEVRKQKDSAPSGTE